MGGIDAGGKWLSDMMEWGHEGASSVREDFSRMKIVDREIKDEWIFCYGFLKTTHENVVWFMVPKPD